jgi:PAS domain-containing protein
MQLKNNPTSVQFSSVAEVLEVILNGIAQPVIVKDRSHRFVFLNDAACTLIGHSRRDLIAAWITASYRRTKPTASGQ